MTLAPEKPAASRLESLALGCFPDLSAGEIKLVRNTELGKMTDCARRAEPVRVAEIEGSDSDRRIRPALLQWLCADAVASELVHQNGIQLWNAEVQGDFDLSFVKVPFPLALVRCQFSDPITLRQAEIPDLILSGASVPGIEAGGLQVKGSVFLRQGFVSSGEISLMAAFIGGTLDCGDAVIRNAAGIGISGTGVAISADHLTVGAGVFLNRGFCAEGEVRFLNARIGGNFTCTGGTFSNPAGFALTLDGVAIDGEVHLSDGFNAKGSVRLLGAQIGGCLDCNGGKFHDEHSEASLALASHGAHVRGSVFLNDGFRAEGAVEFVATRIEKNLECINSTFQGEVNAVGASIGGGFHWLRIKNPELATLILRDAAAVRILDDVASWPVKGSLELDGFVYERISEGPNDARNRLDWLQRQRDFTPQPYRQLAKVLRNDGDGNGAQRVLFRMEHQRRKEKDRNLLSRLLSFLFRITVGYGFYPIPAALGWLAALFALGFFLFWGGYNAGSIVPVDKEAYQAFKNEQLPAYYEHFHSSMYSFENSFQLVKLGQVDRWQPDPTPQQVPLVARDWLHRTARLFISADSLRWYRWFQIILGWFFTAMIVAGVTGIVRKD
jgi:hypothetical protein